MLLHFQGKPKEVKEMELPENFFVISDFHLDHKNIIKYSKRPFGSIKEMNETLVRNWNKVVGEEDTVLFVGDLAFGHKEKMEKWLVLLKGKIVLVKGNHESKSVNAPKELLIKYKTEKFFVTHNPANRPDNWNDWMIHGHVHNKNLEKYPLVNGTNKTINICCELLDYKPVRFEYLVKDLAKTKHWATIKEKPVCL